MAKQELVLTTEAVAWLKQIGINHASVINASIDFEQGTAVKLNLSLFLHREDFVVLGSVIGREPTVKVDADAWYRATKTQEA
jgi:hypothetical protein